MYKALLTLPLLLLCANSLSAQSMYYCERIIGAFDAPYSRVGHLDLNTCIDSIEPQSGMDFLSITWRDFAFHPNGLLYGFGFGTYGVPPNSYPNGIYSFNVNSVFSLNILILEDEYFEAVACDTDGLLYFAGEVLATFEPSTEVYTVIGDFPPEMYAQGGLAFRSGKLYLSTVENTLVEVNMEDPINSTVFMTFPEGTPPIHSLTTMNYTCDSIVTYATGIVGDSSILYEVDFVNQTLIELCETSAKIYGTSSPMELALPECTLFLDLDANNSSGGLINNYLADTFCISPVAISDIDLNLFSASDGVDSMTIELSNILNPSFEFLSATVFTNLILSGNGTEQLHLVNDGSATLLDFENAIASIVYQNSATDVIYGTRAISVRTYHEGFTGEASIAYLPLFSVGIDVETTISDITCYGESDGMIEVEASGVYAPFEYQWDSGENMALINELSEGFYSIHITDQVGCRKDLAFAITEPYLLQVSISNLGTTYVCDSSGILLAESSGGVSPYSWQWNNGVTDDTILNIGTGAYFMTVTDANSCTALSNYNIETTSSFESIEENLCNGETVMVNGQMISADTSFCETYLMEGACDSTICYTIEFSPSYSIIENLAACSGIPIVVDGVTFNSDTSFCKNYVSVLTCDSTICYNLTFNSNITTLDTSICEGEQLFFNDLMLTSSGLYFDTLSTFEGCDSFIFLSLNVFIPTVFIIEAEGNLCEDELVNLSVNNVYSSYLWSNGETTASLSVGSSGNYSLTVTDDHSCTQSAMIFVEENTLVQASVTSINPTCYGDTDGQIMIDTVVGGTAPYLYNLNATSYTQDNLFTNLEAGEYTLYIEDAEGCLFEETISILNPSLFTIDLGNDANIELGDSILLEVFSLPSISSLLWTPDLYLDCDTCRSVVIKPLESNEYFVEAYDENNCLASDFITIFVEKDIEVYAPIAFSPNADGYNDHFFLQSKKDLSIKTFNVFDRWGSLLFEIKNVFTNNHLSGWDGFYNGKILNQGIYIWYAEILLPDGSLKKMSGDVSLLR